ncbi:MAG: Beta-hexosaminidase [Formosa sp. Hel3_A1_48]|nr:MAG: Beta-hexosaminidase [Formosa sp. Hel3_A1_48]
MQRLFIVWIWLFSISMWAQSPLVSNDSLAQKQWVDSIYNAMTLKQKVGQLFMVQAFSDEKKLQKSKLLELIKNQHIGGLIYSNGGPVRQAKLDNELQAASKIPLLVGMDAEWGLNMRLDSTYAFPWNMTLGAIKDLDLIKKTGQYIGEHCKRIGVHFNFAPVVDINTNPQNPIIGNRSFGEDKNNVTEKALAFMQGMQSAGVLANAKHFPGHGDTDQDSHKTLPTISFDKKRIETIELFPYKKLISNGLSSVMVAHLNVPSLEPRANFPSSLSKPIVSDLLKTKLKFEGLIFTDALDMKGVSNFSKPGAIDVQAFLAGNDVLLMSENVEVGMEEIMLSYYSGRISEARLAHSVKKILNAKYKVGLNNYNPIKTKNLVADLNRSKDDLLYAQLMQNAITVVKNYKSTLPIKDLELKNIAYVSMGDRSGKPFLNTLKKYAKITEVKSDNLDQLIQKLKHFNLVIVGFHKSNSSPWKSYKFTNKELVWLQEIARTNEVILNIFSKPYTLDALKSYSNFEGVVVGYQNSATAQKLSAQILFGALSAQGQLPVSISNSMYKVGHGLQTSKIDRLSFGLPESVGMSSAKLSKLDSVANFAIDDKMTPGIQLLVARKGKVIYDKNFGYHTYSKQRKVRAEDLYDLASLTKILVTLPLLMELVEHGSVDLDDRLGDILPQYKKTNKSQITLKEMLSHYARLQPWIPFYQSTLDSVTNKPISRFFRTKKSKKYPIEISENSFLRTDFTDTIHQNIIDSKLLDEKKYRYSDLPYYILKDYLESFYDVSLDALIQQRFYNTIGANYSTYNPLEKFDKTQVIPTEKDTYFRFDTVHGHVHDMGAAMQNGVGGHAGLFSNANDVAKLMQMYLQYGHYGGKQFLTPKTIDAFNTCYFCEEDNRRGVGFDKPQLDEEGPTCGCISMTSFGHSGFTGTYAWADPEEEIIYVFLSNRTFPDSKNNRLLKENIRTEIQRLIYEAILD